MSGVDDDFILEPSFLSPNRRPLAELVSLSAWMRDEPDADGEGDLTGFWIVQQLEILADLEELTETKPLPGIDAARLRRPGYLAYRLAVIGAFLAGESGTASDATTAAAIADGLRDVLRAFLAAKGILRTQDEACWGLSFDASTDPPKADRYPIGSRRDTRIIPDALMVRDDGGQWTPRMRGDLTEADALLAELLETLNAKKDAERILSGGPQTPPWRRWTEGADKGLEPAILAMVRAVWARIKAERARARSSRPAVVRATMADVLLPVMSRQGTLPTLDDGRVLDGKRRELGRIALVSARMTNEGVRRGLELFGSVVGNRLLKSLVLRSHEQQERGDPFALRVRYAGGWAGLAEALGYQAKDTTSLLHLAEAGASVVWSTPHARGLALWALAVTRGNQRRPGEVAFTLNTPLAPGYAAELADEGSTSLVARTARRLVPELRYEPPTGAVRPNEAGAVWTLHRRFLLELVDRAEELVTLGGVALSSDDWRRFAKEVGLPPATLAKVLDSWKAGESAAAPALLIEPEPGRWALADPHDLERRFLLEAGERRLKGRAHGKKAKQGKLAD